MPIPFSKQRPAAPRKAATQTSKPASTYISPEIDLADWQEQVVVVTFDDGVKEKYDCKVNGQMCVRPCESHPGKWNLTHKDTWCRILLVDTEEDAMRIATLFNTECFFAWTKQTPEELREALPSWVREYCVHCTRSGKWEDPTPFIK